MTSPPDGRDRPCLHGLLTSKAPPTRTPILAVGVPTSVSQHDKNKHAHLVSAFRFPVPMHYLTP